MADAALNTGRPLLRVDGPLKVTGGAKYAAEYDAPDLVHGVIPFAWFDERAACWSRAQDV
jgi:hypothetical protein